MEVGTHLFAGVIAASAWPALSTEQKIITVLFSIMPDSFEWLNYFKLKKYNGDGHYTLDDYNKLVVQAKNLFTITYNFLHNIFTPLIFLILSLIFNWPLVYTLAWFLHLLLDLPSHKYKLGLRLWWPFSQKRLRGFFDWWHIKFFRGWEVWGYWAILTVISVILIRNFW